MDGEELRYSVWGSPVPPVCHNAWTQKDWQRYEDRYRPEWYKGERYDMEAWKKVLQEREKDYIDEFYARYGITPEMRQMVDDSAEASELFGDDELERFAEEHRLDTQRKKGATSTSDVEEE